MRYRIKLDIFEGPFDLLLFLIRKNEVDIYDIPIAQITEQFLQYIEVLNILDLNVAGDFVEVVAILMNIKARMLLPKSITSGDEEPEDPRAELVERLIEYKRFKDASGELVALQESRSKHFERRYFRFIPGEDKISDDEYLDKVSLFDLMMAFRQALHNMPKVTHHEVKRINVTVEDQTQILLNRLNQQGMIIFQDFIKEYTDRMMLIITFIALLELMRSGEIEVKQSHVFDDIRIQKRSAA
ncbi:MAG: chromosome segregation protein ScpA [Caldithrix sp.]|nr:chromosome segregation protein ScpA [Caldithrix sp.]